MKAQLPTVITEELLKSKEGDVFGPYEEGKFYKLTKVTQLLKRPDSVKSSHILIPLSDRKLPRLLPQKLKSKLRNLQTVSIDW